MMDKRDHEIVERFGKYKYMDRITEDDLTEHKSYLKKKSLADSRLIFRMRTEMDDIKASMRNMFKGPSVNCDASNLDVAESQVHVMASSGYEDLRWGWT